MDSATSPSVPRRMTSQRHTAKGESFQIKQSNQKEICCYEHLFRIDAMCIGIGLMMCIGIGLMLSAPVMG